LAAEVRKARYLLERRRSASARCPLGLLASGSLLIAVAEEDCERVRDALSHAEIPSSCLGLLTEGTKGVIINDLGERREIPHFQRDELARFLESPETTSAGA
jgi:hydrogenase maturation factor HypE